MNSSWDLRIHTTHFRTPISSPEDGRIRESIDPLRSRADSSELRIHECRCTSRSLDSRIVRSLDVRTSPSRKIPETSNSRISGTLGLSVLGFGRSGSRILGFWHSGITEGSFDPWILRSLYTSSRIYDWIYAIYMKMRSRNLVPLIRSLKKERKKSI